MNNITTSEYFNLLNKENLNPEDIIKKVSYEKYIKLCKEYEDLLSPAAESILKEHNSKVMELSTKENKTIYEDAVLKEFQSTFEQNNEVSKTNDGPVRKRNLANAGYVDATIVLVILLNLGFIIAMALIGAK